jgi:hypothetical protein
MEAFQYKGYTIEEDFNYNPYAVHPMTMFYPTNEGIQDDADYDGDGFNYCGNCQWVSSVEEAKDEIDAAPYVVEWLEKIDGRTHYKFKRIRWLTDAIKEAVARNGGFAIPFQNI